MTQFGRVCSRDFAQDYTPGLQAFPFLIHSISPLTPGVMYIITYTLWLKTMEQFLTWQFIML